MLSKVSGSSGSITGRTLRPNELSRPLLPSGNDEVLPPLAGLQCFEKSLVVFWPSRSKPKSIHAFGDFTLVKVRSPRNSSFSANTSPSYGTHIDWPPAPPLPLLAAEEDIAPVLTADELDT